MGSISCHIKPLVINSLGADTHIPTFADKVILRNQVRTSVWLAHTWFKNGDLKISFADELVEDQVLLENAPVFYVLKACIEFKLE